MLASSRWMGTSFLTSEMATTAFRKSEHSHRERKMPQNISVRTANSSSQMFLRIEKICSIERFWFLFFFVTFFLLLAILVSNLFQSFLPEISAHSFHHMQSGQNDQIRLELLQTGHERLQRAHFPIGHIMGQDEAVSLRSFRGTPLFTCRGRQRENT